jgi:hypothetical protein
MIGLYSIRSNHCWVEVWGWWLLGLLLLILKFLTVWKCASVVQSRRVMGRLKLLGLLLSLANLIKNLDMLVVHYLVLKSDWEISQKCNICHLINPTQEGRFVLKDHLYSQDILRMLRELTKLLIKMDGWRVVMLVLYYQMDLLKLLIEQRTYSNWIRVNT